MNVRAILLGATAVAGAGLLAGLGILVVIALFLIGFFATHH